MSRMDDAVTDLVRNAIGCGVMIALEGRHTLAAKLRQLPSDGTLTDALADDVEGFIRTRSDLVRELTDAATEAVTRA